MENSPLSSLHLVMTSVLDEIQSSNIRVDITRGRRFERLEEVLQMIPVSIKFIPYWMLGLSKIDDKIIYSWCFNFVQCFDLISSTTIDELIETLKSLCVEIKLVKCH